VRELKLMIRECRSNRWIARYMRARIETRFLGLGFFAIKSHAVRARIEIVPL
jgi:hypothetical protein